MLRNELIFTIYLHVNIAHRGRGIRCESYEFHRRLQAFLRGGRLRIFQNHDMRGEEDGNWL